MKTLSGILEKRSWMKRAKLNPGKTGKHCIPERGTAVRVKRDRSSGGQR